MACRRRWARAVNRSRLRLSIRTILFGGNVRTPVADVIEDWFLPARRTASKPPPILPTQSTIFTREVVPLLRKRRLVRSESSHGTLRERLGLAPVPSRSDEFGRSSDSDWRDCRVMTGARWRRSIVLDRVSSGSREWREHPVRRAELEASASGAVCATTAARVPSSRHITAPTRISATSSPATSPRSVATATAL